MVAGATSRGDLFCTTHLYRMCKFSPTPIILANFCWQVRSIQVSLITQPVCLLVDQPNGLINDQGYVRCLLVGLRTETLMLTTKSNKQAAKRVSWWCSRVHENTQYTYMYVELWTLLFWREGCLTLTLTLAKTCTCEQLPIFTISDTYTVCNLCSFLSESES